MKRFVIELANARKESDKRAREVFIGFDAQMRDRKTICIEIDRYVNAYKMGLLTELEASQAILDVKTWQE